MSQEQTNLVDEKTLEYRQRVANMISEGGLGAMYYYNYQFYDDNVYETDETNAMQDTTQHNHIPPH